MKKFKTIFLIMLILFSIVVFCLINFKIMLSKNELAKNNYDKNNYFGTAQELLLNSPEINDLTYEGNKYAPLTMIFVADLNSEESNNFYKNNIQELKSKYVDSGEAKLYHKYIISREDLNSKSGVYAKVQALRCFANLTNKSIVDFQIIVSQAIGNDFTSLAESNGINKENYIDCVENTNFKSTYLDMLETEKFVINGPSIYFGVNGADYTVIYGTPNLDDVYKKLRLKEIKVGLN